MIRYIWNAPFYDLKDRLELIGRRIGADLLEKQYDVVIDPIETMPQLMPMGEADNWAYKAMGADKVEDYLRKNAKQRVKVYIFDTAGAYDHSWLKSLKGRDFTGGGVADVDGHGTHVAGSYIGVGDFDIGLCKVLVEKNLIGVIPVKVLHKNVGTQYGINSGISWAINDSKKYIDRGECVIFSFSLGGGTSRWARTEELLKKAKDLGIISVAASGNSYRRGVNYPGCSEHTLGVASLSKGNVRSAYSTYGPQVYVSAPGDGILSTYLADTFEVLSGTSMATPHIGATIALYASVKQDFKELLKRLPEASLDLGQKGRDEYYGFGGTLIPELLGYDVNISNPI